MIGMLYQPLPLALGGMVFVVLSVVLRRTRFRSFYLLAPAVVWFLAALEEWYMVTYQPQMNIRIDALFFMMLIALVTPVGVLLALLRRRRPEQ